MIIFIAERIVGDDIEPIGVYSSKKKAMENLYPSRGLISEMEIDVTYNRGIGDCIHYYVGGKETIDKMGV